MMINWQNVGTELARLLISTLLSLVLGGLVFRKLIAPEFEARYEESIQTVKNLAKLAGVKSNEFTDAKMLEKVVAKDLIMQNLPELQALKLVLAPGTWEQVEETIEENPEVAIQLYQKYGHLLPKVKGAEDEVDYNY